MTDALRDAIAKGWHAAFRHYTSGHGRTSECEQIMFEHIQPVIQREVEAARQKAFEEAHKYLEYLEPTIVSTLRSHIAGVRQLGDSL